MYAQVIPVVLIATTTQWLETTILLERTWNLGRAFSGLPKVVVTSLLALHHGKVPQGWPPNTAHGKAAPDSSRWLRGLLELSSRAPTVAPPAWPSLTLQLASPRARVPERLVKVTVTFSDLAFETSEVTKCHFHEFYRSK